MTLPSDDFDVKYGIINSETPLHTDLSAKYKQSFAYYTFRVRLPATLAGIASALVNDKDELICKYGADASTDIDNCASSITQLRSDILDNGVLLALEGGEPDTAVWNAFLKQLPVEKCNFFTACWLYAECYMYRRISAVFKATPSLCAYDYFSKQKQTAAQVSFDAMCAVAHATRATLRNAETFQQLLKLNLWGNRCDLSITSGKQVKPTSNAFDQIKALDANLLIDATSDIWQSIGYSGADGIVDIVCDNAGYELFTDLILAEYIIDKGLAKKVRFHVKAIPWFISDVMSHDYHWTLQFLKKSQDVVVSALGQKLQQFTSEGKFELSPLEFYWTSPYEFYRMQQVQPALYQRLAQSKLIIFKGDLNYRKLLGDYSWNSTESFRACLRGFHPSNLCTLRTIKADLICGLPKGLAEKLFAKDKEWMLTGEYGVIQFAGN